MFLLVLFSLIFCPQMRMDKRREVVSSATNSAMR